MHEIHDETDRHLVAFCDESERLVRQMGQELVSTTVLEAHPSGNAELSELLLAAAAERASLDEARRAFEVESAQWRQSFAQWSDRFTTAMADPVVADGAEGDAADELELLRRQCDEFDCERALLESELEALRNQSAELSETIGAQRRQIEQEHAQSRTQLDQMRGMLVQLLKRPTHVGPASAETTAAGGNRSGGDPVSRSVAAQLQQVQRDMARRRGNRGGASE